MGLLILRKILGSYGRWKDNDDILIPLGILLTDVLRDSVLEYIDDPEYKHEEVYGDLSYVKFIKSNKIVVGIQYSEDNPQEIVIEGNNFRNIIKTWQRLKKENVDEIVLKRDNDRVLMIGRSLTDQEKLKQEQALKVWRDTPPELKWDKEYFAEFQKTWRSITPDDVRQLEREFYTQAINDDFIDWSIGEH